MSTTNDKDGLVSHDALATSIQGPTDHVPSAYTRTENDLDYQSCEIDSSSLSMGGCVRPISYMPHSDSADEEVEQVGQAEEDLVIAGHRRHPDQRPLSPLDGDSGQSTISEIAYTVEESGQFVGIDSAAMLQAVVFLEDAYKYRSIDHKVNPRDIQIYRWYQSTGFYIFRYVIIFLLHFLAFFEFPTSLTLTSDLRYQEDRVAIDCWVTQCIELVCLLSLLIDNGIKIYLRGIPYFFRHKWDIGSSVILTVSLIDWSVSFGLGCHEFIRFRRLFRPYFILQHSSLMKKIVNCLRRTVPEVASVLLLLLLHLFIFTLFGMLIFPEIITSGESGYFTDLLDSFISLLVLLTTANNPDITMPAYSKNRFASLFFVLYMLIGLYCYMNMLLAVIYNQFRGYFLTSMQSSLLRRRLGVRASFEVLRRRHTMSLVAAPSPVGFVGVGVGGSVIKSVVEKTKLPLHVKGEIYQGLQGLFNRLLPVKQYQKLFQCLDKAVVRERHPGIPWSSHPTLQKLQKMIVHKYFLYFGILMSLINLILIAVSLVARSDSNFTENSSVLQSTNLFFILYYVFEQCVKVWAFGWKFYFRKKANAFDAIITLALLVGELYLMTLYGFPHFSMSRSGTDGRTLWSIIRVVNIFITVRIMKIIPHIKAMSLVISVLTDLVKNMKAFAGVLVVIFYAFAIVGIELFHGAIEYKPEYVNVTFQCGTYEQLNYWANNFDDFFFVPGGVVGRDDRQ